MKLSIIIVSWKVRELLRESLSALFRETKLPRNELEVIVVDNDSGDGTTGMVRTEFVDVKLIANDKNAGFAAANNLALPLCTAKFVLLLNPDTVVLSHALDTLVARMEARPEVWAMGCRLLNGDGTLQRWTGGAFPTLCNLSTHYLFVDRLLPRRLRPEPLYLDRDVEQETEVAWVSGACMMLRRERLGERIFDEAFFMYGEDMELCRRLRCRGGKVIYCPAASIVHYQGASMRQQSGDILHSSLKGPRRFFAMTHGKGQLCLYDLITLTGFLLRWLAYLAGAITGSSRCLNKASASREYLAIAWKLVRS